jgi:flagellar motor switch protein FliM
MPEILSQQEIDNLLSGIASGQIQQTDVPPVTEKQTKEVSVFDFRLPHRLSKNQVRTFQAVHESFAEAFGSYLVSRLQTNVTVNVSSVDQLFYSEFVLSIASPSCLYVFRIAENIKTTWACD